MISSTPIARTSPTSSPRSRAAPVTASSGRRPCWIGIAIDGPSTSTDFSTAHLEIAGTISPSTLKTTIARTVTSAGGSSRTATAITAHETLRTMSEAAVTLVSWSPRFETTCEPAKQHAENSAHASAGTDAPARRGPNHARLPRRRTSATRSARARDRRRSRRDR
jgi:hypothetical protein